MPKFRLNPDKRFYQDPLWGVAEGIDGWIIFRAKQKETNGSQANNLCPHGKYIIIRKLLFYSTNVMLELHNLCGTPDTLYAGAVLFLWCTGCTSHPTSLSSCQSVCFYVREVLCINLKPDSRTVFFVAFLRPPTQASFHIFANSLKALPDLRSHYVPEDSAQVVFCVSRNWVYIWSNRCVYTRESSWNTNSNTLEPVRLSMTAPSSVLSPSSILPSPSSRCAFIPAKKNLAPFKNVIFYFLITCLK
jgi:hypothetical protein